MKTRYNYLLWIPALLYIIGFLSNKITVAVNGGQMPVLWPGGCEYWPADGDTHHICMTAKSHLKFFSDWIIMHGPHGPMISSVGDLILDLADYISQYFLGAWLALQLYRKNDT